MSVEIVGIDNVLELFEKRKARFWSIFKKKEFMTKGDGVEMLEEFLTMIEPHADGNIYTLKVYDDVTSLSEIKEKTGCDGSFHFALHESSYGNGKYDSINRKNRLFERLEALEARVSGEKEEPATLGDILNDPEKAQQYLGLIQTGLAIVKGIFSTAPAPQMRAVGNIPKPETITRMSDTVKKEYTEADQARLIAAVNTLGANDPMFVEHIEKLARISEKNKQQYQMLAGMLDNMSI